MENKHIENLERNLKLLEHFNTMRELLKQDIDKLSYSALLELFSLREIFFGGFND